MNRFMNGFRPKESRPQQPSVPPMPPPRYVPKCKYLLPCGICDKTNEICSKYGYKVTKAYSEPKEPKNSEDYISDEESAWEDQDYMI